MATQPLAASAAQQLAFGGRDLPNACTVTIGGKATRLSVIHGQVFVLVRDLSLVLGYLPKSEGKVLNIVFENHGLNIDEFTADYVLRGKAAKCINEAGLRKVCEVVKPRRTEVLRAWLAEGGMQRVAAQVGLVKCLDVETFANAAGFPTDRAVIGRKWGDVAEFDDANHAEPHPSSKRAMSPDLMEASSKRAMSPILADDTPPNRPSLSRRKAYARQLCRVIACHATDEETRLLTRALEDVSAAILSRRYCPGLNAASYQAYAELGLQGGAQ